MKFIQRALVVLALLFCAQLTHAQPYQIVGSETTAVAHGLKKTVIVVQEGDNPLNRFLISRVYKGAPGEADRGSLLLLPPLGERRG